MSTQTVDTGKKKGLIPKLRFKEFREQWNTKKLNEVAEINPSNKNLPDRFIYIDLESVVKGQLLKEDGIQKIGSPSRAQRYLKREDILFQMVRPYQMNNLFFDKVGDYVASTGYAQIRTKENSKFIYQYLHLQDFVDKVIERCTGTSYPSINSSDLGNILIKFPTLPEQQKIASFLSAVDEKIQQLTRKKELLEQYKKGVMQQLFSSSELGLQGLKDDRIGADENNPSIPKSYKSQFRQLRFKDPNGKPYPKWGQGRLGELTNKVDKKNKNNFKYPIYSINNYEGFTSQADQFEGVDSHDRGYDISLYKIIYPKTFAYNPARINVGSIGYSGDLNKILISSLYVCFQTTKELDDFYLLHFLKTFSFNNSVLRFAEGGVRQYLFYENFSLIKIPLPSVEEQQKIASFLTALDAKIESVAAQIAHTQTFKKGLLQQMFV